MVNLQNLVLGRACYVFFMHHDTQQYLRNHPWARACSSTPLASSTSKKIQSLLSNITNAGGSSVAATSCCKKHSFSKKKAQWQERKERKERLMDCKE
jgi:hypothetical protein